MKGRDEELVCSGELCVTTRLFIHLIPSIVVLVANWSPPWRVWTTPPLPRVGFGEGQSDVDMCVSHVSK